MDIKHFYYFLLLLEFFNVFILIFFQINVESCISIEEGKWLQNQYSPQVVSS